MKGGGTSSSSVVNRQGSDQESSAVEVEPIPGQEQTGCVHAQSFLLAPRPDVQPPVLPS